MSLSVEYDLEAKGEAIDAIRASRVRCLFVEFLQQGGPKPHVVLRLIIDEINKEGRVWKACRLSMDLLGGYDGGFIITALGFATATNAAHAAFEFKLKTTHWTVNNFIDAIKNETYDLTEFTFVGGFKVPGSAIEYIDGCRDFMNHFNYNHRSQVFITLHKKGVVGWRVHAVDRGVFTKTNFSVKPGKTGFHEIIGYNFRNQGDNKPTQVDELPLARGKFPYYQRTLVYQPDSKHHYPLPYSPSAPEEGDEGYQSTAAGPSVATNQNPTYVSPGTYEGYQDQSTAAGPSVAANQNPIYVSPDTYTCSAWSEWEETEGKWGRYRMVNGEYEFQYHNA